jgi:hypothetical protein
MEIDALHFRFSKSSAKEAMSRWIRQLATAQSKLDRKRSINAQ